MLKEIRKDRNLSQRQLAIKTKIGIRTLQYYEQGKRDINTAKIRTLVILSNALHCKITDLLTDEELIKKCKKTTL